jgi:hypothetical protein
LPPSNSPWPSFWFIEASAWPGAGKAAALALQPAGRSAAGSVPRRGAEAVAVGAAAISTPSPFTPVLSTVILSCLPVPHGFYWPFRVLFSKRRNPTRFRKLDIQNLPNPS